MEEKDLGHLPSWNLKNLYSDFKDIQIDLDIENLEKKVEIFIKEYDGIISKIQADGLYVAVTQYEEIEKILTKLYVFAYLSFTVDMSCDDAKILLQKIKDKYSDVVSKLSFLSIQINEISDEKFNEIIQSGKQIIKYQPYLRDIRRFKNHILSQEIESLIIQKDNSGINAIVRLFDEHETRLRFNINNKILTLSQAMDLLSNKDREIRKEAGIEIGKVFKNNAWFYAIIMNTIAKEKSTMNDLRQYPLPISSRNLANFIEDDVVDCLINSVKHRYPSISHRYYKLKCKLLGVEKLNFYDRNAPIFVNDDKTYTFDDAKNIVLRSYYAFSNEIGDIVKKFFDEEWIDAKPAEFKSSGAFCCSSTSDLNPYIMMNFMGKARDVATLAHELGHGVHMYLSRIQGQLMQDTPLTLAETASIFGEQLTFRELLKGATSKNEKMSLLCQKIEDMINTVIRQIAFCEFEIKIHNARKTSELTESQIGDIWMDIQSKSLGQHVILDENYKYYWTYISHFIHSPFYVYAYAFGDLLVNSLYKVYTMGDVENFPHKYIEMLSTGGTLHHSDLLAPFNLSAKDQDFWNLGLDVIEEMINQVEIMIE